MKTYELLLDPIIVYDRKMDYGWSYSDRYSFP